MELSTLFKDILWTFFISMLPVVELRGAIPAGEALGLPIWINYIVCVLGNMLPVPVIFWFAKAVLVQLSKLKKVGPFFAKIIKRADEKALEIAAYEFWGLFIFVAIPLPGTGAWTGALIAAALRMRFKKAVLAIGLGVLTSGIIMSLITFGVSSLF